MSASRLPGQTSASPPGQRADHDVEPARLVYAFLDFGDGGAQRVTLAELRLLDRSRFSPALLCLRGRGALVAEAQALGVPVVQLGRLNRPLDLAALQAIAGAMRGLAADVLVAQQYSRSLPYLLAAARLSRLPLSVVRHHGYAPSHGAARRFADGLLARNARHLAVCEAVARELRASNLPEADIRVHRHGVDLQTFAQADRAAARTELDLPHDRPLILVPARLDPIKGHADLLAALPTVLALRPDARVICLGEGPERGRLQASVDAAGLGSAFSMLGRRSQMQRWLAACDLVCLPSHAEGLPLALIEAHAAGRAVLATTVGGVPEIVVDGRSGRLVPPRSPRTLAEAMLKMLDDEEGRQSMEIVARQRAETHFDLHQSVRGIEDLLAAWLAERGRSVPAAHPASASPLSSAENGG